MQFSSYVLETRTYSICKTALALNFCNFYYICLWKSSLHVAYSALGHNLEIAMELG